MRRLGTTVLLLVLLSFGCDIHAKKVVVQAFGCDIYTKDEAVQSEMHVLADAVTFFEHRRGRLPRSWDELCPPSCEPKTCFLTARPVDPWGSPIELRTVPRGVEILSAGPNGLREDGRVDDVKVFVPAGGQQGRPTEE